MGERRQAIGAPLVGGDEEDVARSGHREFVPRVKSGPQACLSCARKV
jgi:hypothetical protein